jgi:hypothetical protein
MRKTEAFLKSWGRSINAAGLGMLALGGAAKAGLAFAVKTFSDMGFAAEMMSRRTGASVEAVSALGYIAGQTGTDLESLETAIKRMQKNMVEGALGSKEAAQSFSRLGISAATLKNANVLDVVEQLADRVSKLKNPNEQAAEAMKIFGRSGTDILPLLQLGSAGIKRLAQEAQEFGLIMSAEDSAAAMVLHQKLDLLWQSMKMGVFQIGAALAPELTALAIDLGHAAKATADFVREHKGLVITVAKLATIVTVAGGALVGLGTAFKIVAPLIGLVGGAMSLFATVGGAALTVLGGTISLLGMSVGALAEIITAAITGTATAAFTALTGGAMSAATSVLAMLTPVGVLGFALVGLAGYVLYASGAIGTAVSEATEFFRDLTSDASEAMDGVKAALMRGDVAAAAKLLWSLLILEWERGKAAINHVWLDAKIFFLETWRSAVTTLSGLFLDCFFGIQTAFLNMGQFISEHWDTMIAGMGIVARAAGFNFGAGTDPQKQHDDLKKRHEKDAKDLDDAHKAALRENEKMNDAAIAALEKQKADSIKAAKKAVDAAKAEFDKANAQAKATPANAPLGKGGRGKPGDDELGAQGHVVGTFNAFAVGRLAIGGGGQFDQVNRNTAATVAELRKWNQGSAVARAINAAAGVGGAAMFGAGGAVGAALGLVPGAAPHGAKHKHKPARPPRRPAPFMIDLGKGNPPPPGMVLANEWIKKRIAELWEAEDKAGRVPKDLAGKKKLDDDIRKQAWDEFHKAHPWGKDAQQAANNMAGLPAPLEKINKNTADTVRAIRDLGKAMRDRAAQPDALAGLTFR